MEKKSTHHLERPVRLENHQRKGLIGWAIIAIIWWLVYEWWASDDGDGGHSDDHFRSFSARIKKNDQKFLFSSLPLFITSDEDKRNKTKSIRSGLDEWMNVVFLHRIFATNCCSGKKKHHYFHIAIKVMDINLIRFFILHLQRHQDPKRSVTYWNRNSSIGYKIFFSATSRNKIPIVIIIVARLFRF